MVRAVSILQCPDLDYCGFNWEFHFVSREKKFYFLDVAGKFKHMAKSEGSFPSGVHFYFQVGG